MHPPCTFLPFRVFFKSHQMKACPRVLTCFPYARILAHNLFPLEWSSGGQTFSTSFLWQLRFAYCFLNSLNHPDISLAVSTVFNPHKGNYSTVHWDWGDEWVLGRPAWRKWFEPIDQQLEEVGGRGEGKEEDKNCSVGMILSSTALNWLIQCLGRLFWLKTD